MATNRCVTDGPRHVPYEEVVCGAAGRGDVILACFYPEGCALSRRAIFFVSAVRQALICTPPKLFQLLLN